MADSATVSATGGRPSAGRSLGAVFSHPKAGLLSVWGLLILYSALTQDRFLTEANITNILRSNASLFLLAVGATYALISGGVDLSVGSILALSGVALSQFIGTMPVGVAILLTLGLATLMGAANGVLIGPLGLSPFVVTLGALAAYRGFALIWVDGRTTTVTDDFLVDLGDGKWGSVPVPAVIMVIGLIVCAYLLRFTYFGRDVYAVGGNEQAATLAGIRVGPVRVGVYAISGLFAGVAAVLLVGRLASASPTVAQGWELTAIAAILLGGTTLVGGVGGVGGTAIGVLFLATIDNSLTLAGVSSFWQNVVTGGVLIAALGFDRLRLQFAVRRAASEMTEEEEGETQ
ncbi:MAG: ABC transporter permease [Acidimicrobiales bacterium]